MEYVFYALIVALTSLSTALVIAIMRRIGFFGGYHPKKLADTKQRESPVLHGAAKQVHSIPLSRSHNRIMDEHLRNVPTPWGWPQGHKSGHREMSRSLHDFADKLVQRKTTVDDLEYLHRRDLCIRALLEDRYGRVFDHSGGSQDDHPALSQYSKKTLGAVDQDRTPDSSQSMSSKIGSERRRQKQLTD